jgi:uncharacterized repeat protein (TIGR01451 family)
MRTDASSKRSAPRLAGISALALGVLVVGLITFTGGAGASGHDLVLTKSDSPDPVTRGSNLTYTIQVQNNAAAATGVVVTDTLPSRVDFVSATSTQGTCSQAGGVVTCNIGDMAAGTTATVTIVVRPKQTGTISNTAVVTSTPPDTNTANNSDTESTTVVGKGQAQKKVRPSCAAPTITGTAGDDLIVGTDRADVIVTFGGNDRVFALGGKDLVCAGAGFDLVKGGRGGDILKGGGQADRLIGKAGNDIVIGKAGNDILKGKAGNDILRGKRGRDKLRGNAGSDILNGGPGRDNCKGGSGQDVLKRCP